jgi:outer membrane protein assembly factor BamB
MRRALAIVVVCLAVAGCQPRVDPDPDPGVSLAQPSPLWTAQLDDWHDWPELAEAFGDTIVVRSENGSVAAVDARGGQTLWQQRTTPGQMIVKSRVAQDSVVLLRERGTVEVRDLRTGTLRFSLEHIGTLGIGWTTLFFESSHCVPDCGLRAADPRTGRILWIGPRAWIDNVLFEPGEPLSGHDRRGPLRATDPPRIAVRSLDNRLVYLDPRSGKQLSAMDVRQDGMAVGSDRTMLQWSSTPNCTVRLEAYDAVTGVLSWQTEVRDQLFDSPLACAHHWYPVVASGRLAVLTPQGAPAVLDVDTGRQMWTADPETQWLGMNERAVVARSAREVFAHDAASGARLWAVALPKDAHGAPKRLLHLVISDNVVAYGTEYQRDRAREEITWVRDLTSGKLRSAAIRPGPIGFAGGSPLIGDRGEISLLPG